MSKDLLRQLPSVDRLTQDDRMIYGSLSGVAVCAGLLSLTLTRPRSAGL